MSTAAERWEEHRKKVAEICDGVRAKPEGKTISIRKATGSHQIHDQSWKDKCHRVDVSKLTSIIEYKEMVDRDGEKQIVAVCEGQVNMGQLCEAAFREKKMIPKVVPEFKSFTCAGLINGEGIQSSGHRHGLFTNNVLQLEVVLGDAKAHLASPDDSDANRELFVNTVESYGSIGIVVMACVALRPAKQYVRSSFFHFNNSADFSRMVRAKTEAKAGDFLEGIVIAKNSYVIIQSDFTDTREVQDFYYEPGPSNYGEIWYYQHLRQRVIKDGKVAIEHDLIPTLDFVHRSMRGGYWMIECHINLALMTDTRWIRKWIDKKAEEKESRGFTDHNELDRRNTVVQDMGVKMNRLQEGIDFCNTTLGVYPLWICPVYQKHLDRLHHVHSKTVTHGDPENHIFCDIGVYGEPSVRPFYHRRAVAALINFVDFPSTWGYSYATKAEIKKQYDPAREKFGAIGYFTGREDKIAFRSAENDADDSEREIWMWRLQRDYTKAWPIIVPLILLTLFAIFVGLPLWLVYFVVRSILGLF